MDYDSIIRPNQDRPFFNEILYVFFLRLWPKAEVCQGQTFGYGRRWKLHLRSNTGIVNCSAILLSKSLNFFYTYFVFDTNFNTQQMTWTSLWSLDIKWIFLPDSCRLKCQIVSRQPWNRQKIDSVVNPWTTASWQKYLFATLCYVA